MTQSPNTPPRVPANESEPSGAEITASFLGIGFVVTGVATAAETSFGTFSLPANYEVATTFAVIGTGILVVNGIRRAVQTRRQGTSR
ncbi:MAG TPA: hypothetical protein PJ984_02670 [Candidatus Saccharibacteria bacterium]|nr:hypothetical protein [Candidatus Saccharibacteria bacterium]